MQNKLPEEKPSVKFNIPMNIFRWVVYSVLMLVLLLPVFIARLNVAEWICGALLLGHFSSQLNGLKDKL